MTVSSFKPGIRRRFHVLLSAALWTGIGIFLAWRGLVLSAGDVLVWPFWAGLAAGSLKSTLILDRVARKGLERIRSFSDYTCIGAVYSWRTWLLVGAMMGAGYAMRQASLAAGLRGFICTAVGWSLLYSSRHAWKVWAERNQEG